MIAGVWWLAGMAWLVGSAVLAWFVGRVITLRDRQVARPPLRLVRGSETSDTGSRFGNPEPGDGAA